MEQAIQFESSVESGVIHIPKKYIKIVPPTVIVTLAPVNTPKIKKATKSKAGAVKADSFSAVKINTTGWKFDREEANERR